MSNLVAKWKSHLRTINEKRRQQTRRRKNLEETIRGKAKCDVSNDRIIKNLMVRQALTKVNVNGNGCIGDRRFSIDNLISSEAGYYAKIFENQFKSEINQTRWI